jgi:hypothetical protein
VTTLEQKAPTTPLQSTSLNILRWVLALSALFEAIRACLLLFAQPYFFELTLRPLLDPIITRQYGLFSIPAALFYALLVINPGRYRRFLWIAILQRLLEIFLVLRDPFYTTLPFTQQALVIAPSVLFLAFLFAFYPRLASANSPTPLIKRGVPSAALPLRRLMLFFGSFQLFWAGASIIYLQLGADLIDYPITDVFITQQQGVAVFIIAASSLMVATHVTRYRIFAWVAMMSQGLGVLNSAYESSVGTITLYQAGTQWAIQALIIGAFVYVYSKVPADPIDDIP